jgi:sec-independent protein translocase protein TatA
MFPHLGPMELIIILVIALMIFGAGKLPEVGSALGRGIREFKKATQEEPPEITATTATPAASASPPAAAAPPSPSAGPFCPQCGTQATAGSRFCAKCGASLPTAAA